MAEMKNSLILRTIPLLIAVCLVSISAQAKYGGGSGTANDPYRIATAADLIALGEDPNDYDKHFILTRDIDLDPNLPQGKVFDKAVIAPANGMKYGVQGTPFIGVFDGNGHTISHLTITGAGYLGLFGYLLGAEVRNLGVVDVRITGSGNCVGGLVGYNRRGDVTESYSTGTVSGGGDVGGLVGVNSEGNVTQSYTGSVSGGTLVVGGLVGFNWGGAVQCYSTGAVSGTDEVGGLVGYNYYGTVTQCYSTGAVSGSKNVGGLVGYYYDTVTQCFWDIQTSCQTKSDGGKGLTTTEMKTARTFSCWGADGVWTIDEGRDYPRLWWENAPGDPITRAYYYGGGSGTEGDPYLIYTPEQLSTIGLIECDWDKNFKVMADIDLSGFDGKDGRPSFNIIGTSYNAFSGVFDGNGHTISHLTITGVSYLGLLGYLGSGGEVRDLGVVDVNIAGSGYYVGGLVGYGSPSRVTGSFWDTQTSGQTTSAGGTGKTTAEMQTSSTFLDAGLPAAAGWDFVNIWGIGENQTYPYLRKYSAADINQDASVNFLDLAVLADNWLGPTGP